MLVSDIIYSIRQKLTDTEEPYLWDDIELLKCIRDTLKDIYTFTGYDTVITNINTVANVYLYNISGEVSKAWIGETFLSRIPHNLMLINIALGSAGLPEFFSVANGVLYLYPIPNTIYTVNIIYNPIVDNITTDTDLAFPDIDLVITGSIVNAYLKQDSETFDGKAIELYKREYIEKRALFKNKVVKDNNVTTISRIHGGLL